MGETLSRKQSLLCIIMFFGLSYCCLFVDLQGQNQNIVFDNAVTNLGNAYHPAHGIFTAPVDGTYLFAITVSGISDNNNYFAYLDVNGTTRLWFHVHQYEQSSHVAIVQLKSGNDVSVKNAHTDDHLLGGNYTAFSGFLLYQDFDGYQTVIGK